MDWNVLISAAAGVFGAAVGGGALLKAARDDRAERQVSAHSEALIQLNGALGRLTTLASGWAEVTQHKFQGDPIAFARLRLDIFRHEGWYLDQIVSAGNAVWQELGRAYAVATPVERPVIDRVAKALGDWKFGEPMPASWEPMLAEVRMLLQGRTDSPLPAANESGANDPSAA